MQNQVTIQSIQLASYIASNSPSLTVLLGYIDHCTALNTIVLVTFHYAVIMINTLINSKYITLNIAINYVHSFIKRIRVSNAFITEFRICDWI